MTDYTSMVDQLFINEAVHWKTFEMIQPGEIKPGEGWCGVVYLHDIKWKEQMDDYIASANVNLYLAPFKGANEEITEKTFHRRMME